MVQIPAGGFLMGSEDFYPRERPSSASRSTVLDGRAPRHGRRLSPLRSRDRYVTVAERPLDPAELPTPTASCSCPRALVFRKTTGPVPLDDYRNCGGVRAGRLLEAPGGPGTTINGRDRHPVVQIAFEDAEAYAGWAGKELPTEAEWEYAARGGLEGQPFAWGDEHFPGGEPAANTWQGKFPWQNLKLDGHEGTSPVGSFPPNGYGLYDMTGNTWEWTTDFFTPGREQGMPACCAPTLLPGETFPRRVIKGGSHLCAPNYCLRYRPAARQGEAVDTSRATLASAASCASMGAGHGGPQAFGPRPRP